MSPFPDPLTATIDLQRQIVEETLDFDTKTQEWPERPQEIDHADVGQTSHDIGYEENKLELLHYGPLVDEDERHDISLLFVYALISRPYILDLQPDKSVVRRFLEHGFDIDLIDWNEPSTLDRRLSLDHYVNVYIDNCVNVVRDRSGREAINLFGYCMGGTMSTMYAAPAQRRSGISYYSRRASSPTATRVSWSSGLMATIQKPSPIPSGTCRRSSSPLASRT
jgi:polyhydroxyalkanoate synthase